MGRKSRSLLVSSFFWHLCWEKCICSSVRTRLPASGGTLLRQRMAHEGASACVCRNVWNCAKSGAIGRPPLPAQIYVALLTVSDLSFSGSETCFRSRGVCQMPILQCPGSSNHKDGREEFRRTELTVSLQAAGGS